MKEKRGEQKEACGVRMEELRQGKAELKTEYEKIDFLMERLKKELYAGENLERQLQ